MAHPRTRGRADSRVSPSPLQPAIERGRAVSQVSPSSLQPASKRRCRDDSRARRRLNAAQIQRSTAYGLVLTRGRRPGRYAWSLDKNVPQRDCSVVGHNGLTVGTWWPFGKCALRDGAHGDLDADVAGSFTSGAYSMTLSGAYDGGLIEDLANTIYYTGGPEAHRNTDPDNPIMGPGTQALQASKREDTSIRVLRTESSRSIYSPAIGLRYDGLYKITEEQSLLNQSGGRYLRFTLVRNADQAPIDLSRPNSREQDDMRFLRRVP